ncbi:nucleoside triphosphate pyrophosphohydrolase [Anaerofustis sp. LCP19S3_F7]|uniref:nucleoside triphosphate pyrophosphohydrolase n=1 Tax=Anaerofustis sp. LCP19S3_F7 TaxID=3440247 RepID=UPI003F927A53
MKKNIFVLNIKDINEITLKIKNKIETMDNVIIQKDLYENNILKKSISFDFNDYNNFKNEIANNKDITVIFDTNKYRDFVELMFDDDLLNITLDENNLVNILFGKNSNYKIIDLRIDENINIDFSGINIIKNIDKNNFSSLKEKLLKSFSENIIIYVIKEDKTDKIKLKDFDESFTEGVFTLAIDKQNFTDVKGSFDAFMELIDYLRSDNGCPWDRKQTHKSLKKHLIEESYEVLDALDKEDMNALSDELGDLLMQIALHSQIAKESKEFDYKDVILNVSSKLIRRHPYVFSDTILEGDDTAAVWNSVKKEEKSFVNFRQTLLDVPKGFPALLYAQKIQKRAGDANFDFADYKEAISKLYEEIEEFKNEIGKNEDNLFMEAGDLLFSVVNVLRLIGINSEEALNSSTNKFIRRFVLMEELIEKDNKNMMYFDQENLEKYWEMAKILLK